MKPIHEICNRKFLTAERNRDKLEIINLGASYRQAIFLYIAIFVTLMTLRLANTVEDLGSLERKQKPISHQEWILF